MHAACSSPASCDRYCCDRYCCSRRWDPWVGVRCTMGLHRTAGSPHARALQRLRSPTCRVLPLASRPVLLYCWPRLRVLYEGQDPLEAVSAGRLHNQLLPDKVGGWRQGSEGQGLRVWGVDMTHLSMWQMGQRGPGGPRQATMPGGRAEGGAARCSPPAQDGAATTCLPACMCSPADIGLSHPQAAQLWSPWLLAYVVPCPTCGACPALTCPDLTWPPGCPGRLPGPAWPAGAARGRGDVEECVAVHVAPRAAGAGRQGKPHTHMHARHATPRRGNARRALYITTLGGPYSLSCLEC